MEVGQLTQHLTRTRQFRAARADPMSMDEWRAMRASLGRVRADWRRGRRDGYPLCCIAMFCWDTLWSLPPSRTRAVAQGVEGPDPACDWVPCGVVHHGGSPLSLAERVRRIAAYWWWTLPFMRRRSCPAQGWLRPPWVFPPPSRSEPPAMGPMDEAWAELDARTQDPDLDWR